MGGKEKSRKIRKKITSRPRRKGRQVRCKNILTVMTLSWMGGGEGLQVVYLSRTTTGG
jgi:hypothetical protein